MKDFSNQVMKDLKTPKNLDFSKLMKGSMISRKI